MLDVTEDFLHAEQHNGITFTRLSNMPNIARVESLDDLALWQHKEELGLNGLVTTYPDEQQATRAAIGVITYAQDHEDDFTPIIDTNMVSQSAVGMYSMIYRSAWEGEQENTRIPKLHAKIKNMSEDVQNVVSVLADTFVNTAKASSLHGGTLPLYLRVNSDYPMAPHKHVVEDEKSQSSKAAGDTVTMALSGFGSVLYDDDNFQNSYRMKTGEVALLDENLWHGADKYDEVWEDNHRANIILG